MDILQRNQKRTKDRGSPDKQSKKKGDIYALLIHLGAVADTFLKGLMQDYKQLFKVKSASHSNSIEQVLSSLMNSYQVQVRELINIEQQFSSLALKIQEKLNDILLLVDENFDTNLSGDFINKGSHLEEEKVEIKDCYGTVIESLTEKQEMASWQKFLAMIEVVIEKIIIRKKGGYDMNLTYFLFEALPVISTELPGLGNTLLRFFKKRMSVLILLAAYICALLSEVTLAHLNATYLLGFSEIKGILFAGVIVGVSYVVAFNIFPQVKLLLCKSKKRLNAFWIVYLSFTFLLITSFGFLGYERLMFNSLSDKAVILSEELNNLYLVSESDGKQTGTYQDLINQKDQELGQVMQQLNSGATDLQKWISRIALVLSGLISLVTSSIMIAAIKLTSHVSSAYHQIRKSQKALDKLYSKHEELLTTLKKGRDMHATILYWVLRKQAIDDLLQTPLDDDDLPTYFDILTKQEEDTDDFDGLSPSFGNFGI